MFSTQASGHSTTDETICTEPALKQSGRCWPASHLRRYVIAFSLALNIGFCMYLASQWLAPPSPYKTPEERMHIYLQYLPEAARAEYRERINAQLATLLEMHKQVHDERQMIADLLARDTLDKAALNAHFQTVRDINQKIGRIYQEALVDVEAGMPVDERMKSHYMLSRFLKRDQSATQ